MRFALTCIAAVVLPQAIFGQSCSITSPANNSVWSNPWQGMPLTISTTSAPTGYKAVYKYNYTRVAEGTLKPDSGFIADFYSETSFPFGATWYPAYNGDGAGVVSAKLYDIFNNQLADCGSVTITANYQGYWNQSINAVPASGRGIFGVLSPDGSGAAIGPWVSGRLNPNDGVCGGNGGSTSTGQTGGWKIPTFASTCYPNGIHTIVAGYDPQLWSRLGSFDPLVQAQTFTLSGGNIALTAATNFTYNGAVIFAYSSGTLPAPLTAGCAYYWQSPSSFFSTSQIGTVSAYSSAAGTISITLSSVSGCPSAAPGTPVYIRNVHSTNQTTGQPNCDGYYTMATGSGTAFTVNAPNCPNGAVGGIGNSGNSGNNLEIIVNPLCVIWNSATNISISQTFSAPTVGSNPLCGTAVSLSGGSGTQTYAIRLRSPYWGDTNNGLSGNANTDYFVTGAPLDAVTQVTLANGSAPMELEPNCGEFHGWPGKTADPFCHSGSNDVLVVKAKNTDLSFSSALTCGSGGLTCSYADDGPVTGGISFNGSTGVITYNATSLWSNPSAARAWGTITLTCSSCAAGGASLSPLAVRVENSASSNNFPHYTTCGVTAQAFNSGLPSGCQSFVPLSVQGADLSNATPFLGPALRNSGYNSIASFVPTAGAPLANLYNPIATSCPAIPDSFMSTTESFARTWGLFLEYDAWGLWFNFGNGWASSSAGGGTSQNVGGLPTILRNDGYNRVACLASLMTHLVSSQLYWRLYNDDENVFTGGTILMPNPKIGTTGPSAMWTNAVVSGTGITFNVTNPATLAPNFSQSASTGAWIKIVSAANACLNGWYPILTNSSTQWTSNNIGACSNGTYAPSGGTVTESGAQMVITPSQLGVISGAVNNQQNISSFGALGYNEIGFSHIYVGAAIPGTTVGSSPTLASIVWSGNGATINVNGTNPFPSSGALRIWVATNTNLNGVYTITGTTTSTVTISSNCSASFPQQACPANGTYTSATDANLIVTNDPNWGPNPLQQFFTDFDTPANHVVHNFAVLGSQFFNQPSTYSYEGNPANVDGSFLYTSNPNIGFNFSGYSNGVWNWQNMNTVNNPGGLTTRAWQMKPRSYLWYAGMVGGGQSAPGCGIGWTFVPYCDRPSDILFRGEDVVAQRIGMYALNIVGDRLYNILGNSSLISGTSLTNRGWQGASGGGGAMNQADSPIAWHASALVNAFETLTADTHLQPESNKPYYGPMFAVDAHTSSAYGNSFLIACGAEDPYGAFTVNLPQISGGSTLKYVLTAQSLAPPQLLAGNPSSDRDEFCSAPGRTTLYVSQPSGYTALDQITFAPPMQSGVVTLPFGASKFLVQVGYFPQAMQDDPVTDCTAGCTIGIDHHSYNAWYRVIYADANNLPRSIGDAVRVPSQGLP